MSRKIRTRSSITEDIVQTESWSYPHGVSLELQQTFLCGKRNSICLTHDNLEQIAYAPYSHLVHASVSTFAYVRLLLKDVCGFQKRRGRKEKII